MPSPLQINANIQFDQFVQFAQREMDAGHSKAIARTGDKTDGPFGDLAVRTVVVASDDKVFAIRRSAVSKRGNDAARDMFKTAIAHMYGGESHIPESVLKAMNLKDYGSGKPLTARRIIAVRDAMAIESAKVDKLVPTISSAATKLGVQCTEEQQRQAAALLCKYGAKNRLSDEQSRLLAGNLVRIVTNPDLAPQADYFVSRIAKDISTLRSFMPGDARAKKLDSAIAAYVKVGIKEFSQKDIRVRADDIRTDLIRDSVRSGVVIAGKTLLKDVATEEQIAEAFKDAIKKPLHRRVISAFMSQISGDVPTAMSMRVPTSATKSFPKGAPLHTAKGAEMMVGHTLSDGFYLMSPLDVNTIGCRLDIGPDGKSAKVTYTLSGNIRCDIAHAGGPKANESVGTFSITQEYTFDLSKDAPKLTAYHIGQTFDA